MPVDQDGLRAIADECVLLVRADFGRPLDGSVDSLDVLDDVCGALRRDPTFAGERFDLWWKLVGAYTGQVVVDRYSGEWVEHERASGAYAVTAMGITGFPFGVALNALEVSTDGEVSSLAAFVRSLPVIAERTSASREKPDS